MKLPDRNVLAGGIVAVIVWALMQCAAALGHPVDAAYQGLLITLISFAIAHYVPPSAQDIISKLNDAIVKLAQQDPNSNVSYVVPPVAVPPGEPATIGGPPTVGGLAIVTPPAAMKPPIVKNG